MEKNDGFVILTADCDIQIPDIYNTPVYSYERKHMTDELLNKLCDYFSDGDRLYEDPAMTKSELNREKDKLLNYKGRWQGYSDEVFRHRFLEYKEKLEELIVKAPENKEEHKYINAGLTTLHQTEIEYVKGYWYEKAWYAWYHDTEEKIGFTARIDKGR